MSTTQFNTTGPELGNSSQAQTITRRKRLDPESGDDLDQQGDQGND